MRLFSLVNLLKACVMLSFYVSRTLLNLTVEYAIAIMQMFLSGQVLLLGM